jgi:hypothetical protein
LRAAALLTLALACAKPEDTGAPPDKADDSGDSGDSGQPEPTCDYLAPSDALVLETACVDGACGGQTYPEVQAQLGAPEACTAAASLATCVWGPVSITFPDCDQDGAPDEDDLCDQFDQTFTLSAGWTGSSAEGLGIGVTAACWAEALGAAQPWSLGANPFVVVTVSPAEGPVQEIVLDWTFEE